MPRVGRARYHSTTLRSNTGTGSVVAAVRGAGRGIVIRKKLIQRVGGPNCHQNCYTSFSFKPTTRY